MQIAVLSDLHLGARDRLDRFLRRPEADHGLIDLLRRLEKSVDRIVLLGDIFETLRGLVPGTSQQQLVAAMDAYPEVAKRALGDPRYVWVQGNHDFVGSRAHGIAEFHPEEDDKSRVLFFHGHQLCWLERGRAPLSRLGVWAGGMLERMGLPVTHVVDRVPTDGERWRGKPGDIIDRAVRAARTAGADIVVNGHTHRSVREERGDTLYMNSGTCVAGRREYLLLDTSADRYEIIVEST